MQQRTENIRAAARRLLEEGTVDCVVGYREATIPTRNAPFVAYTPEETDKLIWNSLCGLNTATVASQLFANGFEGKVAIIAQGCASRNINGLILENRLKRENIHVIGVPCLGMCSPHMIEERFAEKTILSIDHSDAELIVRGRDASGSEFEEKVDRRQVKRENCNTCQHRNPKIADELVADEVEETAGGNIDLMAGPWEKLKPAERWAQFEETFKDCIRCYACRDACPLCFCSECFVDESKPQWCGKTQDPADVQTFHIMRAFHCAGRCTDCGSCETACPVGIKMRRLTSKQEKIVREMWGFEQGMNSEDHPPLSTFKLDDAEPHFK